LKLGLGTAQFGLDYGVTNAKGRVDRAEVTSILRMADSHGIEFVDTAPSYGDSEATLGAALPERNGFKIITKTLPIQKQEITRHDVEKVCEVFRGSLEHLGQHAVHGLLVHDPKDLLAEGAELLVHALQELKAEGFVHRIGVSVYRGDEIDRIFDRHSLDLVQLPLNVLDQRLVASGHLAKLKGRGVEIHARSVFLQGLLLAAPGEIPAHLQGARASLERFARWTAQEHVSPAQAALAFVEQLALVDCAIVGVVSAAQLRDLLQSYSRVSARNLRFEGLGCEDPHVVDPTLWPQRVASR
jgi:aryl-alcohol dehydrogenase-like predicted oxidoreductase